MPTPSTRLAIPLPFGSDANTRAQRLAELNAIDGAAALDTDLQTHKAAPSPHTGHLVNYGSVPGEQAGLDADRPTATGSGRLYWASDTAVGYRDIGPGSWQKIAVKDFTLLDNRPGAYPPLAHAASHAYPGGTDAISPGSIRAVDRAGDTMTGTLTVSAGGITITAGGLTINGGGLNVASGTSTFAAAVTVSAGGITITTGGLTVTAGGVTITAGGLTINGGNIAVPVGGISITGGGLTIATGGLTVTAGGLTVTAGGITIVGGNINVPAGGTSITGGPVTFPSALTAQGGITATGPTDTVGILSAAPALTAVGTQSGLRKVLRANSFDTQNHTRDFALRARTTSNAGAGIFELLTRLDGGADSVLWGVDNTGRVTLNGQAYTWPAAYPAAAGSYLTSDTTGVLAWSPGSVTAVAGTANQITSTLTGTTVTLSLPTALILPGNLTLGGSARVLGDFSNATYANRTLFQTSTVNGLTDVGAVPNGTSVQSSLTAWGAAAPVNSPYGQLMIVSTDVRLTSGVIGTGTYLPLTFYTGGSERLRIDTAGNFLFPSSARITGDFSNATLASRTLFQSSTANGSTNVGTIPNGTGAGSGFVANALADPTNSPYLWMVSQAGAANQIISGVSGTGAYLPLTIWNGGSERIRITSGGLVGIGMTPSSMLDVSGVIRSTSATGVATTGAGTELAWTGTVGNVFAFNRGTGVYQSMQMTGQPVSLAYGATTVLTITSTAGVTIPASIGLNGAGPALTNGVISIANISNPPTNIMSLQGPGGNHNVAAQTWGGNPPNNWIRFAVATGTGASQAVPLTLDGSGRALLASAGDGGGHFGYLYYPPGAGDKEMFECDSSTAGFGIGLNSGELCIFPGTTSIVTMKTGSLSGTRTFMIDSGGNETILGVLAQSGSWRALKKNIQPVAADVRQGALTWVRDTMEISQFALKTDQAGMHPHLGIVFDHPYRPLPDNLREMITATPNGEISLGDAWGFNLMLIQQLAREVDELRQQLASK